MSKFIGLVSAYAYAKSKGYTGTEEEFAILMAEYASVTETAVEAVRIATESAQSAAAASSDVNRAAATVTQQAAQVHDDAETSSESAATASEAKETAVDKALDSEAYALGTRDGEDVGSSDPAYHNNAKYYAEQTATDRTAAQTSAQTATAKASEAQASASAAAESARTLTIDPTLTQAGQAADAKKTGDKIDSLKADLIHIDDAVKDIGVLKKGQFNDGSVLFSSTDIKEGNIIYYSFDALPGYNGFIDIFDTSGNRITYIGKGSTSVTENHYEGSYVIPSNFGEVVARARAGSSNLSYIIVNYAISNNLVKYLYDNTSQVNSQILSTGDLTDRTNEIQSILDRTGIVRLGAGNFYISSTIVVPENGVIEGVGDATVIVADDTQTIITLTDHCTIKNFTIKGALTTKPSSQGIQCGISVTQQHKENRIININIDGIDGNAIYANNTYSGYSLGHKSNIIQNCRIINSGCGIYIGIRSEAFDVSNCSITECYIGLHCIGGNNRIVSTLIRGCSVGIDMTSYNASDNDGHSVFDGLIIIHNIKSVVINTIENGSVFTGCSIFAGIIEIADTQGVIFVGSIIGSVTKIQATNSSGVRFSNCVFMTDPTTVSGVLLNNCTKKDGTDYSG